MRPNIEKAASNDPSDQRQRHPVSQDDVDAFDAAARHACTGERDHLLGEVERMNARAHGSG